MFLFKLMDMINFFICICWATTNSKSSIKRFTSKLCLQGHREKDSMSMQLSTGTAAVCFGEETAGSWLEINNALKRCWQVIDLSMINSKPCPSIVDRIRRRRLSGRPFLRTEGTWFDLHATL